LATACPSDRTDPSSARREGVGRRGWPRPFAGLVVGVLIVVAVTVAPPGSDVSDAAAPPDPGCSSAPFVDVPVGHPFCGAIAWLASSGVAQGHVDGTFRPGVATTRQAMAVYLYRLAGSPVGPGCTSAPFVDVPVGHPFCEPIAWLASTGITDGYPDGTFHPADPVPRQAVAAFLFRGEDLLRTEVPDLDVTAEVGGLSRPWDVAFAPDGTMLYTERIGRISAVVDDTPRVLDTPADVRVGGEGGMLGLAVDPDFDVNRRIYACFNSNLGGPFDVRVVRFAVNDDWTALTDRSDIVTGMPAAGSGRHSGCRPRFGPDGFLWITAGDAAMGTNPQNPNSLGGKVLRVDTDGAGAPGNPGGALRGEIYSFGHRNPQGIAFDADGDPYSIEHGPGCDDEINELVAGSNHGWDPVPGYNESVPMTDLVKYPDAVPARWSSGCPTIAPSGGAFLSGAAWRGWDGALAVAVLKDQHLRVMRFVGDDLTLEYMPITDQGRLRGATLGPDGALYLTQDASPGAILRVAPAPCGGGDVQPNRDYSPAVNKQNGWPAGSTITRSRSVARSGGW
jgi:glucose/arabinose dehydrogenase